MDFTHIGFSRSDRDNLSFDQEKEEKGVSELMR